MAGFSPPIRSCKIEFRKSLEQASFLRRPGIRTADEPLAITLENATQEMQKQFLQLSTNSKQYIAATAGHHLPNEAPDFVIDGILEGVHDVRATQPVTGTRH